MANAHEMSVAHQVTRLLRAVAAAALMAAAASGAAGALARPSHPATGDVTSVSTYNSTSSVQSSVTAAAAPHSDVTLTPHDQLGGAVLAVGAEGEVAYVGVGPRLVAVDVSDPSHVHVIGESAAFPGIVRGIALEDGFAYVAAGAEGGLRVVDISQPAILRELSELPTPGDATHVDVADGHAYVACGAAGGLRVVDVSDPNELWEVASVDTPGHARQVVVSHGHAYVADGTVDWRPSGTGAGATFHEGVLRVIDVSDPSSPVEVAALDPGGVAISVAVRGDFAYVTAYDRSAAQSPETYLAAIDVSDKAAPVLSSRLAIPQSWGRYVAPRGDRLFVEGSLVSIERPDYPMLVGRGVDGADAAIVGDALCVADDHNGLAVYDLTEVDLGDIERLSAPARLRWPSYVTVRPAGTTTGNLVVADFDELWNLAVDPSGPVRARGRYGIHGADIRGVAAQRDLAYLAIAGEEGGRLEIIDLDDPDRPGAVGKVELGPAPSAVAVRGARAYVPSLSDQPGLSVVSLADATRPRRAGFMSGLAGYGESLLLADDLAYLTSAWDGLSILDVADPLRPGLVWHGQWRGDSVALVGRHLYVLDTDRLHVVDATDPYRPTELGRLELPAGQTGLAVWNDDYLVAANRPYGICVIDVSDPAAPAVVAEHWTPGRASAVTVRPGTGSSGIIFVADDTGGLTIFSVEPGAPAASEAGTDASPAFPPRDRYGPAPLGVAGAAVESGPGAAAVAGPPGPADARTSGPAYEARRGVAGAQDKPEVVVPSPQHLALSLVSQMGGAVSSVATHNSVVYAAVGPRVMALDLAQPSAPVPMGDSNPLPGLVRHVVTDGDHVYAAAGRGGLAIFEVSDSGDLKPLSRLDLPGEAVGVAVDGSWAYVALGEHGVRIVDILDRRHPRAVSGLHTGGAAAAVTIHGSHAYVAAGEAGMRVLDVADPQHAREVAALTSVSDVRRITMSGDLALVAGGVNGLYTVDCSVPTHPIVVGELSQPEYRFLGPQGETRAVAAEGGLAFLAGSFLGLHSGSGVRVVDVVDPKSPAELGFFATPGRAVDVALSDGVATVAAATGGLQFLDTAQPERPVEIAFRDTIGDAAHVVVAADQVAVSDLSFGLRQVGVSSPMSPSEVARHFGYRGARHALTDGQTVHLVSGSGLLQHLWWRDPAGWRSDGAFGSDGAKPFEARQTAMVGDLLVAVGSRGLRVFDTRSPSAPAELAAVEFDAEATGVAAGRGQLAYVAVGPDGVRVVDLVDPRRPQVVGQLKAPGETRFDPRSVVVGGDLLFVADGAVGVRIADISEPRQPLEISRLDSPDALHTALSGRYLWIADGSSGVIVADIYEPHAPRIVAAMHTVGRASAISVVEDTGYVADGPGGLSIVRLFHYEPVASAPAYLPYAAANR